MTLWPTSDTIDPDQRALSDEIDIDKSPLVHPGLILSDSALIFDKENISDHINCDAPVLNYHLDTEEIGHHLLQPNLEFVLIQDSGKVVSDQDSLDSESLNEIRTLVGQQLELARTVVRLKPDTEVFIGSLPPRYDTAAHTQLAEAYNDIIVVESFLDERITIVSQKGMHTNEMRKVRERFSDDGNMLTKYGTHLMIKNIWRQMSDKISGLRVEHNKNKRRFGKYKFKTKRLPEAIFT